MRSWIHLSKGKVLRQAHVGLEALGGLKEDMLSRQGFVGRVAILYRRNEPNAWSRVEGDVKPLDVDSYRLEPADQTDPAGAPLRLFYNDDIVVSLSRRSAAMPHYVRNADGDEVYFVHQGTGRLETEFGPIPYEPGDYVVIPRGVTYRVVPDGETNHFLLIETIDEIGFADIGPMGRHAPFDPALLFVPSPEDTVQDAGAGSDGEWVVKMKRGNEWHSIVYPFDPLDVVGWKGDLFPFKINIRDYRPITSDRVHLMPSAHGIFQAKGMVICNFLPRPAEGEREVERVPPFHRNVDYDELVFSHGDRALGEPLPPGGIFLLPQGIHHGTPDAVAQRARVNWRRDEYYEQKLISIDTERPLAVAPEVLAALYPETRTEAEEVAAQ